MNKQNLKMIPCPKCSEPFPELRKINYGYNHCVNCSTVEKKVAITTVEGTGDHTYNDLIIMEADQYRSIAAKAAELSGDKQSLIELLDLERDENAVSQSIKEAVNATLTDDIDVIYD
jgi:hypothetical protein